MGATGEGLSGRRQNGPPTQRVGLETAPLLRKIRPPLGKLFGHFWRGPWAEAARLRVTATTARSPPLTITSSTATPANAAGAGPSSANESSVLRGGKEETEEAAASAPPASSWQSWSWSNGSWGPGGASSGYRGDVSDPPTWPGWSHRRQWTQAIKRWDKLSDLPVQKKGEKVLRTLGWELQVDFEHFQLSGPSYLDHILHVIELKAGVREDDEKRQAFRGVMHDNGRRRGECLSQYATRRQRDFSKAACFGLDLPAELRVSLLREGAHLSEQNQQNLTTLIKGHEKDVDYLAAQLARMVVAIASPAIAAWRTRAPRSSSPPTWTWRVRRRGHG